MKAIKTLALAAAISFASVTAYAGGCCASKAKASAEGAKADAAKVVNTANTTTTAAASTSAECADKVAKAECSSEKAAQCSDAEKKQCSATETKASASAEKPSGKDDN